MKGKYNYMTYMVIMHTPIELILYHISHIKKLSILMWQQKNYDEIKYTRARKLFL